MQRPQEPRIRLSGPPIVPVTEPPSEPAMPPNRPVHVTPVPLDAEGLAEMLRPVVAEMTALRRAFEVAVPQMVEVFRRIAQATEEANRGAELRHRSSRVGRH